MSFATSNPSLHIGVGICSTSSPLAPEAFERGVCGLQALGYRAVCPLHPSRDYDVLSAERFVVATAQERAQALMELFEDPNVKFIVSARGGYGTIEVLPYLDYARIAKHPKAIVGFSDATALLVALYSRANIPAIHGPSLMTGFANYETNPTMRQGVDATLAMLAGGGFPLKFSGRTIRPGRARGPVIVGNLSMLQTLLATPWDVSFDGCILVIEDVNEAPYRVHRILNHLRFAGKLARLQGLVFGRFSGYAESKGQTLDDLPALVAKDVLGDTSYPILTGVSVGHDGLNLPIPLGCEAELCADTLELISWQRYATLSKS